MPITGPDMKQPREKTLLFEGSLSADHVIKLLSKRYVLEQTESFSARKLFYDTFDWRLFRNGAVLTASGNQWELFRNNEVSVIDSPDGRRKKYFWWDIRESELGKRLKTMSDMRALLQVFALNYEISNFRVLNRDRKTVARIGLRNETACSDSAQLSLPRRLTVQEIRGYSGVFDKIINSCTKSGLKLLEGEYRLLELAFSVADRKVLDYGAKFSVDLGETLTIGESVAKICFDLAGAMETNYDGVCKDVDSEFLHDFRIAIRRSRSLLTLLKKVLPSGKTNHFQSEFKWLGSLTGPVRDIDVYLLKRDEYRGMLPASLHAGLNLFFEELELRRVRELKVLRQNLNSSRYHELIESWRSYLGDTESDLFSGIRKKPCVPLADTLIRKRFAGFLRDGDKISDSSADSELHTLRIKGKKLRYLLEFFRSFYNDAEMERFLKQMKKLQDNLGDFNDLSVQQDMLALRLSELRGRSKRTMQMGASLGGLITALSRKHRLVRKAFQKTYSDFSKTGNRNLLNKMVSTSCRRVS
jgi:CHAD domain-containing protein